MSFLDPPPNGRSATGSPSPSIGSTTPLPDSSGENGSAKKRKRDPTSIVYSQPGLTGYGSEVNTQITFVIEYLKKKSGEVKGLSDILEHLSLNRKPDSHKEALVRVMRVNPRIEWISDPALKKQTWASGSYTHRPVIPNVRDETALLALLQGLTDASSVSLKDLKDGWMNCDEALTKLESQHRIRVVRTKKDARIWPDDPSLCHDDMDQEFRDMWRRVLIPPTDEIARKLLAVGLKPASEDPRLRQTGPANQRQQKKRAPRKIGKATNTHMEHLLQSWEADGNK